MSKADWVIELAEKGTPGSVLCWQQAAVGPMILAFPERERRRADRMAIELVEMLPENVVVRVRHRLGYKRGCFIPRPKQARRAG